jgi:hypothetical protein
MKLEKSWKEHWKKIFKNLEEDELFQNQLKQLLTEFYIKKNKDSKDTVRHLKKLKTTLRKEYKELKRKKSYGRDISKPHKRKPKERWQDKVHREMCL